MGKDNKCKIVPNTGVAGKVRPSCSHCGAIIEDIKKTACPVCKRRIKPSKFSRELLQK